ncbi:hypothetical protein BLSTO_05701 [Blastocystis sp. subtype 1]
MRDFFYLLLQEYIQIDNQVIYVISHRYYYAFSSNRILHDFMLQKLEWTAIPRAAYSLLFEDIHQVSRFQSAFLTEKHRVTSIPFSFVCSFTRRCEFVEELSFSKGDSMLVFDCVKDTEWWRAETVNGRIGTIPCNYVKKQSPDPAFECFSTNAGVTLMDIIQFESDEDKPMCNHNSCFAFSICGKGEFIFQLKHDDFEKIHSIIAEHYPAFPIPSLPSPNDSRAVYKSRVYEFFHFLSDHPIVTPFIVDWTRRLHQVAVSPFPGWKVVCHTSYIPSPSEETPFHEPLIPIHQNEQFTLVDIRDGVFLEVENDFAHGWCSLHHCEIVFEDIDVFDHFNLSRFFPFCLPSSQGLELLHRDRLFQQSFFLNERFGVHPVVGDTVLLFVQCFLWNSIRGYMYNIASKTKHPLSHVIGESDVDSNCGGEA